ncbi:Uncharacterised protein [Mycobacteroides abscessus]|nr:Uncharacterised protein [Mycobacteroides abscessus]
MKTVKTATNGSANSQATSACRRRWTAPAVRRRRPSVVVVMTDGPCYQPSPSVSALAWMAFAASSEDT